MSNKNIVDSYNPLIIRIPDMENIFDYNEKPEYSTNIDYPRFSFGFQHFIHATKKKMQILDQFKNKKKVYHVLDAFNRHIDEYENTISSELSKYIKIDESEINPDFLKYWEILHMFDLINDDSNFVSAHLSDGYLAQVVLNFRDKYFKNTNKDKYYVLAAYKNELTSDISDKTKRIKINEKTNDKMNLVTANLGYTEYGSYIQEQTSFKLLIAQINKAINIQKKDGNFVLKFYENFTNMSLKIIAILKSLYEQVILIKPFTSKLSKSERYCVCLKFKFDSKNLTSITKKMENIVESNDKNDKNIVDIFPDYKFDKNFINTMIYANLFLENRQFKALNDIIIFINSQNFMGELYQEKRLQQIEATKNWIANFLDKNVKQTLQNKVKEIIINHSKKVKTY